MLDNGRRKRGGVTKKEPEQELSMVHISTGLWLMGIDLVHDEQTVTKNALGIFHISGEEELYHMVDKGVDMDEAEIKKAVAIMDEVKTLAKSLGVPLTDFLEAVKKLGVVVEGQRGE